MYSFSVNLKFFMKVVIQQTGQNLEFVSKGVQVEHCFQGVGQGCLLNGPN